MENLLYFLKVCECKSFTAASEELHLSQAALSSSIKKLEDSLNAQLFTRHRRGVYLTELGEQIYPHIKNIVSEYAIVEQLCSAQQQKPVTIEKINILTHPLIADTYLSELAISTLNNHPQCHIQVREASIERCIEELGHQNYDIILIPIPKSQLDKALLDSNFYIAEKVGDDYLAVEMHLSHPLAHKNTITFKDLSCTNVIFINQDHEKDASLASYYFDIRKLKNFIETDNLALYRKYIANGFVAFTFNTLRKNAISYFSKEKDILVKSLHPKCPFTYYMFLKPSDSPLVQELAQKIQNNNYFSAP